ncbi:DUF4254 domain-containing protein [Streptomyces virginiae]|uniref:DUF4254 domain-containing protein n=1 Tax=Streptomyces virginiae TaxID=1961 RepID=UPI00365DC10B
MTDSLREPGPSETDVSRLRTLLGEALEKAERQWSGIPGRDQHELFNTIGELFDQNREQWKLEDVSHDPSTGLAELAHAKRMIDRSNAVRTGLINRIDHLSHHLEQRLTDTGTPPSVHLSETVGELADRICILLLKEQYATDHAARELANRKSRHLARSLELTLMAMVQGRAVLPPRGIMKIYSQVEDHQA